MLEFLWVWGCVLVGPTGVRIVSGWGGNRFKTRDIRQNWCPDSVRIVSARVPQLPARIPQRSARILRISARIPQGPPRIPPMPARASKNPQKTIPAHWASAISCKSHQGIQPISQGPAKHSSTHTVEHLGVELACFNNGWLGLFPTASGRGRFTHARSKWTCFAHMWSDPVCWASSWGKLGCFGHAMGGLSGNDLHTHGPSRSALHASLTHGPVGLLCTPMVRVGLLCMPVGLLCMPIFTHM